MLSASICLFFLSPVFFLRFEFGACEGTEIGIQIRGLYDEQMLSLCSVISKMAVNNEDKFTIEKLKC